MLEIHDKSAIIDGLIALLNESLEYLVCEYYGGCVHLSEIGPTMNLRRPRKNLGSGDGTLVASFWVHNSILHMELTSALYRHHKYDLSNPNILDTVVSDLRSLDKWYIERLETRKEDPYNHIPYYPSIICGTTPLFIETASQILPFMLF